MTAAATNINGKISHHEEPNLFIFKSVFILQILKTLIFINSKVMGSFFIPIIVLLNKHLKYNNL